MKSDTIIISNTGNGFHDAVEQTRKVAVYNGIEGLNAVQLEVLTEEMLSLARSITGQMTAFFWIEVENGKAELHMSTKTVLDKEQRAELIASSTSRKNEKAKTFLGMIRDRFEEAMAAEVQHETLPYDILQDIAPGNFTEAEWDGYERSILRTLADEVKIGIQGGYVDITVTKQF